MGLTAVGGRAANSNPGTLSLEHINSNAFHLQHIST